MAEIICIVELHSRVLAGQGSSFELKIFFLSSVLILARPSKIASGLLQSGFLFDEILNLNLFG